MQFAISHIAKVYDNNFGVFWLRQDERISKIRILSTTSILEK
jgi:hypothetical protein